MEVARLEEVEGLLREYRRRFGVKHLPSTYPEMKRLHESAHARYRAQLPGWQLAAASYEERMRAWAAAIEDVGAVLPWKTVRGIQNGEGWLSAVLLIMTFFGVPLALGTAPLLAVPLLALPVYAGVLGHRSANRKEARRQATLCQPRSLMDLALSRR